MLREGVEAGLVAEFVGWVCVGGDEVFNGGTVRLWGDDVAHAGSCWERQWRVPRPQTRSTAWMPTDFAGGEAGGDDVEGVAVVGVVEGGDEDEAVGDVEVGVAGGEALAFEDDRGGHWELDDLEGVTCQVAEVAEAVEVFGEGQVIFVVGVGLDGGEDLVSGDEAGDVVDVAVGVVAGAAFVEPEDLFDAEVVVEGLLEVMAGLVFGAEAGVALLDLGEEALFGGEEEACAVGVDAAAFEDEAVGLPM